MEIRCGVAADRERVAATAPDVVVCATGATCDRDGVSPALPGRTLAVTAGGMVRDLGDAVDSALTDPHSLGAHVIIVDDTGEYLPLGLADLLSGAGVRIELVSRHPVVGLTARQALEGPHVLGRLAARDANLIAGHHLLAVDGGRVTLREDWSGRERELSGVDTVVLSLLRTPDYALYDELAAVLPGVRRVGDALAPRRTHEIIHEAEETARAI